MTDWEKRALELFPYVAPNEHYIAPMDVVRKDALRLGKEMADARAVEIAETLERNSREMLSFCSGDSGYKMAAVIARGTVCKAACKPAKTREHVLEEALREILGVDVGWDKALAIIERALEWKPE